MTQGPFQVLPGSKPQSSVACEPQVIYVGRELRPGFELQQIPPFRTREIREGVSREERELRSQIHSAEMQEGREEKPHHRAVRDPARSCGGRRERFR